jgi:hypothetical protein
MEGGDLKLVASKVGRIHLGKTKLSGSTRRNPKSRAKRGGTGGLLQLARATSPKPNQPLISNASL